MDAAVLDAAMLGAFAERVVVPEAAVAKLPDDLAFEIGAAVLLTYGTAYRAVVERLAVRPGHSILLTGGGKGTSFAGAQIAKALGARVILMGSNPELGRSLIARGIADAFVDRRAVPEEVFGVLGPDVDHQAWRRKTEPFREAVYRANGGRPVDRVFEHTGGRNFPLLVSALAEDGALAFFGATGKGFKGEYRETFFYEGSRLVFDARDPENQPPHRVRRTPAVVEHLVPGFVSSRRHVLTKSAQQIVEERHWESTGADCSAEGQEYL